jgi:hypothetical protein
MPEAAEVLADPALAAEAPEDLGLRNPELLRVSAIRSRSLARERGTGSGQIRWSASSRRQ